MPLVQTPRDEILTEHFPFVTNLGARVQRIQRAQGVAQENAQWHVNELPQGFFFTPVEWQALQRLGNVPLRIPLRPTPRPLEALHPGPHIRQGSEIA